MGQCAKLITTQSDIELIHHARPVRVQLHFFMQKSSLTRRPAGCVFKPYAVFQWGVLGYEKLDAASIRWQTQLIKQLLKVMVG